MYGRTCCKVVVTTNGSLAVCPELNHDLKSTSSCDHEEPDTRMLLHVRDALLNGSHMKQLIRTNFSDVLVLVVSSIAGIKRALACVLNRTTTSIYCSSSNCKTTWTKTRFATLPAFHALTGSGTASAFYGHGKKSAWNVWLLSRSKMYQMEVNKYATLPIENFVLRLNG